MSKNMTEDLWKRAERDMVRRERVKRIHSGVIVSAARGLPNVMARDFSGKWWPNSNFVGGS